MSKSKKNVVDPEAIINAYGADTARWFMLSDSPPGRDINWSESGVKGAWKFINKLWNIIIENKVGAQYSSSQTSMAYSDPELKIIRPVDETIFAEPNQVYQVRYPQKDIKVRVKNFQNVSFS